MSREPEIVGASERALLAPPQHALEKPAIELGVAAPVDKGAPTGPIGIGPDAQRWAARLPRILSRSPAPIRKRLAPAFRASFEWELDRGVAFLFMPVCLATGALFYFSLSLEPSAHSVVLATAVLSVALVSCPTRPWLRMAVSAALFVMLGVAVAKVETWRHGTKMLGGEISTLLTGRVAAIDHLANGRIRLTLDVVATERPTLRYAPNRVRASARAAPEGVRIGTTVTGIVRLMPISGPLRRGSYDFSFESYFDGLGATGFFLKGPELTVDEKPSIAAEKLTVFVENARLAIAERIRNRIGGAEGEIAAALVVGIRAGIPDGVNEALRRSGLYHVISISGLHMALVAGSIIGALRLGFALFPGFSSRYPVKKFAAGAALVIAGAYLFFSGAEVAAQRSFLMLAVMLAAVLFDRPAITMRNLAIAAAAVIAVSPHEVVGPSFQMSFAATAALIGVYAAWSQFRASRLKSRVLDRQPIALRLARRLGLGLAGLAATSLIAGFATAIFGAYHFQRVSPLGLGANLAAMPVVSVLVMPFAVLAAVAMPFGVDGPFLDVMGEGLSIMIAVADWFSARSPLDSVGTVPSLTVVLLSVALLVGTLLTTWLRMLAIPFAAFGLIAVTLGSTPDVMVSEDGRLVAVALGQAGIAVNRSRPSAFVLEDWQRSLAAETVVRPTMGSLPERARAGEGFHCREGLCLLRHPSGAVIAHAADKPAASRACGIVDLLIVDDATVRNPCRDRATTVIGKRTLARRGAASVALPSVRGTAGSSRAVVTYAIPTPYRPWHDHRRFSRAARSLPPYAGRDGNAKEAGGEAAGSSKPLRAVEASAQ